MSESVNTRRQLCRVTYARCGWCDREIAVAVEVPTGEVLRRPGAAQGAYCSASHRQMASRARQKRS